MTTPNDAAEPSLASAGSHGSPLAWAVFEADGHCVGTYAKQEHARIVIEELSCDGMVYEPLYRSPTLTDDEREAIKRAAALVGSQPCDNDQAMEDYETLRGLLERLG